MSLPIASTSSKTPPYPTSQTELKDTAATDPERKTTGDETTAKVFPRNAIIAVDNCDSTSALTWALDNYIRTGDVVHLVHCYDKLSAFPTIEMDLMHLSFLHSPSREEKRLQRRNEAKVLDSFKAIALAKNIPGVVYKQHLMVGDPREVLIRLSNTWKSSALIIGSRGDSIMKKFFLGSVSNYLVDHSVAPVIIIHSPLTKATHPEVLKEGAKENSSPIICGLSCVALRNACDSLCDGLCSVVPSTIREVLPSCHKDWCSSSAAKTKTGPTAKQTPATSSNTGNCCTNSECECTPCECPVPCDCPEESTASPPESPASYSTSEAASDKSTEGSSSDSTDEQFIKVNGEVAQGPSSTKSSFGPQKPF